MLHDYHLPQHVLLCFASRSNWTDCSWFYHSTPHDKDYFSSRFLLSAWYSDKFPYPVMHGNVFILRLVWARAIALGSFSEAEIVFLGSLDWVVRVLPIYKVSTPPSTTTCDSGGTNFDARLSTPLFALSNIDCVISVIKPPLLFQIEQTFWSSTWGSFIQSVPCGIYDLSERLFK